MCQAGLAPTVLAKSGPTSVPRRLRQTWRVNAWPFDDVPNLGVFVTHEVLRQGMPILWVVHDCDGDWAFGGEGDVEVDTTSLVCLSHVVDDHPEVAELADLPRGWRADRNSADDLWIRAEDEEEEGDDE